MFIYTRGADSFNPSQAFTILALIALITAPIQLLVNAFSQIGVALGCFERIQAYLLLNTTETNGHPRSKSIADASMNRKEGIQMTEMSHKYLPSETADNDIVLELRNASFTYENVLEPTMRNLNMQVRSSTLTMIFGPVGSGKSTLLKTILKHAYQSRPLLTIAYCAQDPWLPNLTLQNIVMGESDLDPEWYSAVLDACDLQADIASLPYGHQTVIGTNGISLSGGQRQRLALARAIYARKMVLLLDDVLSGLDDATGQAVVQEVLGLRGICRKHGMAVVIVTHATKYMQLANQVIILDRNGNVQDPCPPKDLASREDFLQELGPQYARNAAQTSQIEPARKSEPSAPAAKLQDMQQDLARRTGDFTVYKYYIQSLGWGNAAVFLVLLIVELFSQKFIDIWVKWWSENSFHLSTHEYIGVDAVLSGCYLIATIVSIPYLLVYIVPISSAKLHLQLLQATIYAPYHFFLNTDAGVTLTRFSQDMSIIDNQLAGGVLMASYGAGAVIAESMLIATGQKYLAIAIPFLIIVLYFLQKFYLRTSRQLRFLELESKSPVFTHFMETISGVSTIQAFGWEASSIKRCMELVDITQRPYYLMFSIQRWLALVLDTVTAALAVVIVAIAMSIPSSTSAGAIGVALLNVINFSGSLSFLITTWTQLETSLGAIARVKNFETEIVPEDKTTSSPSIPTTWPQSGALQITDLSASYGSEPHSSNVLHNVNLSIKSGEKIGFIGRSGSGKSSLLLALFRMITITHGSIHLDGIDLATVPPELIRQRIAAVPQECILFPGSVRFNTDPLCLASDTAIISALQRVQLWKVVEERGGLDAQLDSAALSQGQRQLLSLVRVLLRKAEVRVLVLDEVTSSVDAETEKRMIEIVREEFRGVTMLAIAHRLKSIADFDTVVVLDGGRVVEVGTPAQLLRVEETL
jgi:ATP-binding cassette subfamily C (CFTR/MRP) protein 1